MSTFQSAITAATECARPGRHRRTLSPVELSAITELRRQGRSFAYIGRALGMCHKTIRRELKQLGISTAPLLQQRMTLSDDAAQAAIEMRERGHMV